MDDMSFLPSNHESFLSQQNSTMEDDTIDLDGVDLGFEPNHDKDIEKNDKKRKRKTSNKPRKMFAECWKYFDPKSEPDENRVIAKMVSCKWCPAVYKDDFVKNGTDLEKIPKRADFKVCKKVVAFLEKFKETTELVSSVSSPVAHLWFREILNIDKHLREWQENASFTEMISKIRPKHLIENGCIPMEVDEESEETPIQFLTNEELSDKLVKKIKKDMRVLFVMYKEKYGSNVSSDMPKSTLSQTTNTSHRRGNDFLNSFKDKVENKLSGGEDELTKYLKESRLELEDDEYFDILNWWKLNGLRFLKDM
uniref:Zinc finger BED domain-containing protein RICESLEEPER 2 n=1 Tax=Tanacetum cinerariifolium TaxID=118510 RepID=A0A6L2MCH2_TANCI|nr:zinc finger BED domain-containing protein RICESLEEPER 2 [Tanacetum cinerariifolium]